MPTKIEWTHIPGTIGETWNPILGYKDYYVSDTGRIWSERTKKFLKPIKSDDGYSYVFLYDGKGNSIRIRIHRAVLMAFRGVPGENEETRHLDGNPQNNCLSNLAWGTRKENVEDRRKHGRMPIPHESKFTKLTPADIPIIRQLQAICSSREVAQVFGTSHTSILKIWRGERWKGY